jgi:mono/diheme cytochrome c family protein
MSSSGVAGAEAKSAAEFEEYPVKRFLGKCSTPDRRRSREQPWALMLLVLIANAIVCPNSLLAQSGSNPATPNDSGSGAQQFKQYCAPCHGNDGTGNGPVASELKRKPANLTLLSKNNHGVFPTTEVRDFIVGTRAIASHGTREMPVWGYAFMFRPGALAGPFVPVRTPQQVEDKVNLLVDYVKSIQRK